MPDKSAKTKSRESFKVNHDVVYKCFEEESNFFFLQMENRNVNLQNCWSRSQVLAKSLRTLNSPLLIAFLALGALALLDNMKKKCFLGKPLFSRESMFSGKPMSSLGKT